MTRPSGCHVSDCCQLPDLSQSLSRVVRHTVIKPIPEWIEAMLDKVFCCSEVEPRVDWKSCQLRPVSERLWIDMHSWIMLSNRITEKRRLEMAAAAMKQRVMSRSRPLVLRPVSPSKNWLPTLDAIVSSEVEVAQLKATCVLPCSSVG